jgi:hypothetical protein
MKLLYIILLFLIPVSAISAESTVLPYVHRVWQEFEKNSEAVDYGSELKQESLFLHFGKSSKSTDDVRKVKILSSKLTDSTLRVTIQFTQTVYSVTDLLPVEAANEVEVIRQLKLDMLRPETDYTVEFYCVKKVMAGSGQDITSEAHKTPKMFARLTILSEKSWLAEMKKNLEVANVASPEFKKFLEKKIPQVDVSANDYKTLIESLKKIASASGFDLVFFPGAEVFQKPVSILKVQESYVSKSQEFKLSFKNISFQELLLRAVVLGGLKYKINQKGIIIASEETFKTSEVATNKKNMKLPGLDIDVKNKKVTLEAQICLTEGILEYLMCLPNSFEHESIFMIKVKPELLHMGLLLIGSEPLPFKGRELAMLNVKNNKSRLKIEVSWMDNGKEKKFDLNKLLLDRQDEKKKLVAKDSWYFAGSYFTEKNVYAANLHMSIISLHKHPASVIHYGEHATDPHQSENGGFEVNNKICPDYGTKVKLIFSVVKKK